MPHDAESYDADEYEQRTDPRLEVIVFVTPGVEPKVRQRLESVAAELVELTGDVVVIQRHELAKVVDINVLRSKTAEQKRTYIVPADAPAFELPEDHRLKLVHGARDYAELSLPVGASSLFVLDRVAEEDDCVLLYLGQQVTATGPRAVGDDGEPPVSLGYAFPPE